MNQVSSFLIYYYVNLYCNTHIIHVALIFHSLIRIFKNWENEFEANKKAFQLNANRPLSSWYREGGSLYDEGQLNMLEGSLHGEVCACRGGGSFMWG